MTDQIPQNDIDKIEKYIQDKRPPEELRGKVDLAFKIDGKEIEIYEIRPHWKEKDLILNHSIAKVKYIKTKKRYNVYWMPSDMTWHQYEPNMTVRYISKFLQILENDAHGCFWG